MPNTYDQLQPVPTTVTRLDDPDMAVVTVQSRFDWKFWAAIALGAYGLYILGKSMKRAARHG